MSVAPRQLPAQRIPPVRVPGQILRVREVASGRVRPGALSVSLLGGVVAGVHGYLRNRHWGWAAAWAIGGLACPVVTISFAVSQGFGKRAT